MKMKISLLALVVVSAAAFALPAGASAAELHTTNVTAASATFGPLTFTAQEEPVFTCGQLGATPETLNHTTISYDAGGTTASYAIDLTGCHTSVFGFTAKCRTEGSPLDNTIKLSGTFHLITVNSKPGILVTPEHTTINCAGISNTTTTGNLIGTITSPSCGGTSNNLTIAFEAVGATQTHKSYTGLTYNLTAQTSGGAIKEAGLAFTVTETSGTAGTLDCT